jgi:hypothetical protein
MAMDATEIWRDCFQQWPPEIARRGVIVTSFQEQIPFDGFAASEQMLLIERRAPDSVGARMVMIPYQNILALKIVDVLRAKSFSQLGFVAPTPPSKK